MRIAGPYPCNMSLKNVEWNDARTPKLRETLDAPDNRFQLL